MNVRYLYASHALSAFGDRSWQFAIPLLLLIAWGDKQSLIAPAMYQLALYICLFLVLPYFGRLAARVDRLRAMRWATIGQNLCTILTCIALLVLYDERLTISDRVTTLQSASLVLLVLCSVMAEIGGEVARVCLERDWVAILFSNDEGNTTLQHVNSWMRRIDLSCKLCSPLLFGLLLQGVGHFARSTEFDMNMMIERNLTNSDTKYDMSMIERSLTNSETNLSDRYKIVVGSGALALYNIISIIPQYTFARKVYLSATVLQTSPQNSNRERISQEHNEPSRRLCDSWWTYFKHPVFVASLAYSFLYLTVLSNGTLMTAYLQASEFPEGVLGLGRGAGAAMGLLGTSLYPNIKKLCGGSLVTAGTISVITFWLLLLPVAVVQFLPTGAISIDSQNYVLIAGVVLSRGALWSFDLSHTEIMQVFVAEKLRTEINMCQSATYQVFYLLLAVAGAIFSQPSQFKYLVLVSVTSVTIAVVMYTSWTFLVGSKLVKPGEPLLSDSQVQLDGEEEEEVAGW